MANTESGKAFENEVEYKLLHNWQLIDGDIEYYKNYRYSKYYSDKYRNRMEFMVFHRGIRHRIECKFQLYKGSVSEKMSDLFFDFANTDQYDSLILIYNGQGIDLDVIEYWKGHVNSKLIVPITQNKKPVFIGNIHETHRYFYDNYLRGIIGGFSDY